MKKPEGKAVLMFLKPQTQEEYEAEAKRYFDALDYGFEVFKETIPEQRVKGQPCPTCNDTGMLCCVPNPEPLPVARTFTKRAKMSWLRLFLCLIGKHEWIHRVVSEDYDYTYCTHCLAKKENKC